MDSPSLKRRVSENNVLTAKHLPRIFHGKNHGLFLMPCDVTLGQTYLATPWAIECVLSDLRLSV